MARSHRRLATLAAAGAAAGLATLAAAGSAAAATGPQHAAPNSKGTVCVVTALNTPVTVQADLCSVIVVRHDGLVTILLNDLL